MNDRITKNVLKRKVAKWTMQALGFVKNAFAKMTFRKYFITYLLNIFRCFIKLLCYIQRFAFAFHSDDSTLYHGRKRGKFHVTILFWDLTKLMLNAHNNITNHFLIFISYRLNKLTALNFPKISSTLSI